MKKFLIVNYNSPEIYAECVPYLWLTLRSYFLRNSKDPNAWEWLDPIYSPMGQSTDDLVKAIVDQAPDVIGISCYMWNDLLTFKVIEEVKRQLPEVKIIAGGPALYYERDSSWFIKHWYVDALCEYASYGEVFITDYLDGVDIKNIPGAIYPALRRAFWNKSLGKLDRRSFNWPMPYLDNADYLKRFKQKHNSVKVLLDTSRGCPYACSFCEWGGGTSTKVSFKPKEETLREIDFIFEELKPMMIEFINANFGIVKDDIEYAQKIYDLNEQHKCVRDINLYGPTKTNKPNLKKIYELFIRGKMLTSLKLSIQSTSPEVLKNIDRIDMPYDEQVDLFNDLSKKYGVSLRFETMIGLPGETMDSYYSMLYELSKSELLYPLMHEWQMLPSAPAANPEYIEKFKLKTKHIMYWHQTLNNIGFMPRNKYSENKVDTGYRNILNDSEYILPYEVVTQSYSYTQEEWVKMILVKYFFISLNSNNIITPFYKYLQRTRKIDMQNFYKEFFNEFIFEMPLVKKCYDKIIASLPNDVIDTTYADVSPNLPYIHYQALFKFIVMMDPTAFFTSLTDWLESKYGDDIYVQDLGLFVSSMVMTPITYNSDLGKVIDCQFDWLSWIGEKDFTQPPEELYGAYRIDMKKHNWGNNFSHRDRIRETISMCGTWDDSIYFDQVEQCQP